MPKGGKRVGITQEQFDEIHRRNADKEAPKSIAAEMCLSAAFVRRIINGHTPICMNPGEPLRLRPWSSMTLHEKAWWPSVAARIP